MKGICKLCQKEDELRLSHFIPKFIGKWTRKTSVTGYMRNINSLHRRSQDIDKEYWLCGSCEQIFSNWEREFANKIFYPFVEKGESVAQYENWLSKFCASISWRTLTYLRSINSDFDEKPEKKLELDKAEEHLRKYLLGDVDNLYRYEQHLFHIDGVESTVGFKCPASINRYFMRMLSMDIVEGDNEYFIYTKLPSFILIGVVKYDRSGLMRASRIAINKGVISPRDYTLPYQFLGYISNQARLMIESHNRIPQQHLDGFENYVMNNIDKVVNTKQFDAFLSDYLMFGDDVFK